MKKLKKELKENLVGWVFILSLILSISSCYVMIDFSELPTEYTITTQDSFSPDGDGENDTWIPQTNTLWDSYKLTIYDCNNRYVWKTHDQDQEFNGIMEDFSNNGWYDSLYYYSISAKSKEYKVRMYGTIKNTSYLR